MTVAGELDLAGAPRLHQVLARVLGALRRPDVLVVDVSLLTLLSAAGLTVLYGAHELAADTGVRLRIVTGPRPSTARRILRVTGLDSVFDAYRTLPDTHVSLPPLGEL